MHSFLVFLQKEFLELIRTKRVFILLAIFVLFGMLSPVLARFVQEIINMAMGGAELPVEIPAATWIDGWSQLYKNLAQMGNLCIIFLFMSSVSGEKQSGSAALTLTKNLSSTGFILAKYISAAIVLLVTLFVSLAVCYGYTYYLFGEAGSFADVLMGMVFYALFNFVLLAAVVLCSTLSRSAIVSALTAFGAFIALTLSNYLPAIGKYMPGILQVKPIEISAGLQFAEWLPTTLIAVGFIVALIAGAIFVLKRQEL
jgi:ABC-2 type transport system permease protein